MINKHWNARDQV